MSKLFSFAALTLVVLAVGSLEAQSPEPVIIEAATAAPAGPATSNVAASTNVDASNDVMQLLQDMQATNAETIKRQEAALETLDALQKAADEIKIFSKRG